MAVKPSPPIEDRLARLKVKSNSNSQSVNNSAQSKNMDNVRVDEVENFDLRYLTGGGSGKSTKLK